GAPARQAHLVADAVFPSMSPGAVAIIYHASEGVLADAVPQAIEEVLRARGVAPISMTYQRGSTPLPPADAAFLSLSPPDSEAWLADARSAGYRPTRGVAGVYPLLDDGLVSAMPAGTRLVSPYRLPHGAEADALRAHSGHL